MTEKSFDPKDWERLLLLNSDDIDYRALPDEVLEKLALSEEQSIATLALSELVTRAAPSAQGIAQKILDSADSDRFLKAAAIEGLYEIDPSAAFDYIRAHAGEADPYVVESMVSLIVENEPDQTAEPARSAIQALLKRLQSRPKEGEILSQRRADFLEAYGSPMQKPKI